ncbi:glutamate--tRNA ligase [Nonomuraea sp. NPDC003707]
MYERSFIDSLFPADLPEPAYWEERFPPRQLPPGARVTRFCPSPTGPLHIGGISTAILCEDIARHSGGTYLVRIEDTDQARELPGVKEQFERAFQVFDVVPRESVWTGGNYGPYIQSARRDIYLTYVRDLLRRGHAYLCFATKDELAAMTEAQQAAKIPTGYYGEWAAWREKPAEDVEKALAEGRPYVVRFRSDAEPGARVSFVDATRGTAELNANHNDVVILKSSHLETPLPTYHFAHAVDDHLMRVNLVVRGDEWLSSVPVHLQLFAALGFDQIEYAHFAPLLKLDKGNKRKLSKRKDPEASVSYYYETGYPPEAVRYYLRGLMNGRLAEMPLAEARSVPIDLSGLTPSGALVDVVKLDDICADYVAGLSGPQILQAVADWAGGYDPELADALAAEPDRALGALSIEREGVENPRKDLRRWSEFRTVYGYFFDSLFTAVTELPDKLAGIDRTVVAAFARDFIDAYTEIDDPDQWFDQIRELAAKHGFAPNPREYRAAPERYHGSIREASQIVRVALTGSTRSPDLQAVAKCLERDTVIRRVGALATIS